MILSNPEKYFLTHCHSSMPSASSKSARLRLIGSKQALSVPGKTVWISVTWIFPWYRGVDEMP
ncbi:hypothetical protein, partial [Paraburkholderia sp. SIMBA_054]|uniref:hypothetical protein n=1 Tax=Paraburkholderia sp. SIMBA_054 TaxID=3085795 RepID=UPI00397C9523